MTTTAQDYDVRSIQDHIAQPEASIKPDVLANIPVMRTESGGIDPRSLATVFDEDAKQYNVVSSISDRGQLLSPEQAQDQARQTGKYLGKFDTSKQAREYSERLLAAQQKTMDARRLDEISKERDILHEAKMRVASELMNSPETKKLQALSDSMDRAAGSGKAPANTLKMALDNARREAEASITKQRFSAIQKRESQLLEEEKAIRDRQSPPHPVAKPEQKPVEPEPSETTERPPDRSTQVAEDRRRKSQLSDIEDQFTEVTTRLEQLEATPKESTKKKRLLLPIGDGGLDYDYCYVGIKKVTIPAKTTNYLKIYLNGTTTPEWVSAMPVGDQDADAVVFDVTRNRIYLNGEVSG